MALPRDCLELLQEQKSRNTTSLAIRKNRRIPVVYSLSLFVISALPEQFFDRFAGITRRGRNVLEPAAKRIIVAHGCVVDPERGIDRGGDIFGIDGTLFRPSRIVGVECIGRGFAQRAPSASWQRRQIGDEVAQADIELTGRAVDSRIRSIDILMVVPTTQRDLDVARTKVRSNDVARRDTRIPKSVVAVLLLIGG